MNNLKRNDYLIRLEARENNYMVQICISPHQAEQTPLQHRSGSPLLPAGYLKSYQIHILIGKYSTYTLLASIHDAGFENLTGFTMIQRHKHT